MPSRLHDAILELLAAHPEALLAALHAPPDDWPPDLELHPGAPSRDELLLRRRGETTPFAALAVEVQLAKDDEAPYAWLLAHAERHARLRVPSYVVVITHDPAVAAWAAGPFDFGTITMRPQVLAPADLLEARGVTLDPPLRQRIAACTDLDRLAQWLRRAIDTTVGERIFAP